MKIPLAILCVILASLLAGEAWTLSSLIDVKVSLARLEARFDARLASVSHRKTMKSWKTTLFGSLTGLGASLVGIASATDWLTATENHYFKLTGLLLTIIGPVLGGMFARDNNVTSEQAGAKPSLPSQLPLWLALGFLALNLTACSTTAQRAAFDSVGTVQVTVDAAMSAWGDYVATFHPPADQEITVRDAFQKYQDAAVLVIDAEQALEKSTSDDPAALAGAKIREQNAVNAASHALADLVGLLRKFKVKI